MKKYNKEFAEDIALLKNLHAKKDKAEFNALKSEIMQKYKISKATVYREIKKEVPGTYKIPNYNPQKMDITKEEALMVRELLLQGRQNQEIMKIMTRELGIHYYWDRFDRARKMAEELDESVYDPQRSYFPVRGNMFFEMLMGIEYMAEDTYKEIDINGEKIRVSKRSAELIKICLMSDNPLISEKTENWLIQDEIITHTELKEGIRRKIYQMIRTGETLSPYALKSLLETKQKIERRDGAIRRAIKNQLEERKIAEEQLNKQITTKGGKKEKEKEKEKFKIIPQRAF